MGLLSLLSYLAITVGVVQALPSPIVPGEPHVQSPRAGVSILSAATLSSLAPFTQLARAAYCESSVLTGWECGRTSCFLAVVGGF